jgi:hypothetical protein
MADPGIGAGALHEVLAGPAGVDCVEAAMGTLPLTS